MLGSWRCAPGSACPITFTKEEGDTSEYEQWDSHESVPHECSRLPGKNDLTTIVTGSNKTQSEFFHKISTAYQMVPRDSDRNTGKAGPLLCRPPAWHSCYVSQSSDWLPILRHTANWNFKTSMPIYRTPSKAQDCGRSLAWFAGSDPAGGMDVCLLWVSCVVCATGQSLV